MDARNADQGRTEAARALVTSGPLARQSGRDGRAAEAAEAAERPSGRAAEQGRSWRWRQVASDGLSIRDEDFQDAPEKIATPVRPSPGCPWSSVSSPTAAASTRSPPGAGWRGTDFSCAYLPRLTAEETGTGPDRARRNRPGTRADRRRRGDRRSRRGGAHRRRGRCRRGDRTARGAERRAVQRPRADPDRSGLPGRVTSVSTFFSLGAAPLSHPVTGAAGRPVGHRAGLTVSVAVRALGAVHGVCSKGLRSAELPR